MKKLFFLNNILKIVILYKLENEIELNEKLEN